MMNSRDNHLHCYHFASLKTRPSSSTPSLPPDRSSSRHYQTAIDSILKFVDDLPFCAEDLKISDVDIQTYWQLVSFLEDPRRVGRRVAEKARYNYNERTRTFVLRRMPTIVHDAAQSYCSIEYAKMYKRDFLTEDEISLLSLHFGADDFLPSGRARQGNPSGTKKEGGIKKQADVSFSYGTDPAFPSLVWEVGFTESYADLLEDARQWLEKSGGAVKLVILVKLEEGKPSMRPTIANSMKEQDDHKQIDSDNSDDPGEEEANADSGQLGSDPDSYQNLRRSCKTDDWVGRITGFLETWRYEEVSGKMVQDGSRITLLPATTEDATLNRALQISKEDLKGSHSTAEDKTHLFKLDLDDYRKRLRTARNQLACSRMICYLEGMRKRKRAAVGDGDSDRDFEEEEAGEIGENERGEGDTEEMDPCRGL